MHREPSLLQRIAAFIGLRERQAQRKPADTRYTLEQLARSPKLWALWIASAMDRSGRGRCTPSFRHTGRGDDRRKDKLEGGMAGARKCFRSYEQRYACPPIRLTEKSARRRRNLMAGAMA